VDEETVRVDDPDPAEVRVTLVGLTDAVKPEGDVAVERTTVPAKPYRLARLMLEVPDVPEEIVIVVGLAEMLKSGGGVTVTDTVVV